MARTQLVRCANCNWNRLPKDVKKELKKIMRKVAERHEKKVNKDDPASHV